MTTISTPVEIGSRSPRPVLLAVASAVFGAAIGLGVGTLMDSDDPATMDPSPASTSDAPSAAVTQVPEARRGGVIEGDGGLDATSDAPSAAVTQVPEARRGGVIEGDGGFDATSDDPSAYDATPAEMQMLPDVPRGVLR